MRTLITGGAGFIGSHLALRLLQEGHQVTVLDVLSAQIHGPEPETTSPLFASIRDKVRFVQGSVCNRDTLVGCIQDQDAVVHLAAETGTGQSMYEVHRYSDTNVGGTALLLDVLANERGRHQVRRVVVASSRAIYGEGKYRSPDGTIVYPGPRSAEDMTRGRFEPVCPKTGKDLTPMPTDEDSLIHPNSVYGITKQVQEQLVMTVCQSIGLEAVSLRYQNVYGPGQSLSNPYTGILSIFSTRILNGNPIHIFEDGKESRDFVYIDDVVDATCAALLVPEAAGHTFGIGTGVATDVLGVAEKLRAKLNPEATIKITGAFRSGDIRHNFADTRKARDILGYSHKVSFDAGISAFADWVKKQQVAPDVYEQSIAEMASKGLFSRTPDK